MKQFDIKLNESVERMPQKSELVEDEYVEYVRKKAGEFHKKSFSQWTPDDLSEIAVKLTGIYSYVEGIVNRERYKRDAMKQRREEVYNDLFRDYKDKLDTVAEAKNRSDSDLSEVDQRIIEQEKRYRDSKSILNACERMISVVQSVLKIIEKEKFHSNFD